MPTTRRKQIKTVYKNSDSEEETGDFSDSGSDAKISEESSSDEDEEDGGGSSGDDFKFIKRKPCTSQIKRRPKFSKTLINKINKSSSGEQLEDNADGNDPVLFSVKDLTDADKLLPSILNLSESDSSDDECPKPRPTKNVSIPSTSQFYEEYNSDKEQNDYKDVFSSNIQDNSEEIAKKTFIELELHKTKIEQTKASIQNYNMQQEKVNESNIEDLLALGEEVLNAPSQPFQQKKGKRRNYKDDSDSDMEDWEEVKERKEIPAQGLQLIVDLPDLVCRKSKKIDVEMMMKRKINRVKKEYQVYMHKVHVLCWLGHGNYVSRVLNDQEILAAALTLVPSKECYPGERVDMKYLEQITTWYKDKIVLKQDKNEDKFRPKAPPLKALLIEQMKKKTATAKKYVVFIFIAMLRALGLQCRVMFNFVTLPIKPPVSELCSLSTKPNNAKSNSKEQNKKSVRPHSNVTENYKKKSTKDQNLKINQLDGNCNNELCTDSQYGNIDQLDGNSDIMSTKVCRTRATKTRNISDNETAGKEDVSPPKRARKSPSPKLDKSKKPNKKIDKKGIVAATSMKQQNKKDVLESCSKEFQKSNHEGKSNKGVPLELSPRKTRNSKINKPTTNNLPKRENEELLNKESFTKKSSHIRKQESTPKIIITSENENKISSKFFSTDTSTKADGTLRLSRKRSQTTNLTTFQKNNSPCDKQAGNSKSRTHSAPEKAGEKSKYFSDSEEKNVAKKKPRLSVKSAHVKDNTEDKKRVSHKDLVKSRPKPKGDVTADLVSIIKNRVKEAKEDAKKGIVKGKVKHESDEDSDFLPEEAQKKPNPDSDDDFKPTKISPKAAINRKPSTSKKDRRVLSSDEDTPKNKMDVWCEVYVEELEQWIAVDVISGKIHCPEFIYGRATHPVCYAVGWDNNNYLKDLTRRYVPHWNTVTRKLRAELLWWSKAIQPWLGPKTARDREEDLHLDRMQLEAPLPKSIAEYKNHPLYALKRHLLKFEAIYPPDAAALGFVRGEPVFARDCVHTCRSRDTWLKEAKVVRLAEQPYKVVKARPKWDKLSNKLITDKPLEVFGPWQVQDYEPPVAENGMVPRNAYGNVELFKDCMLPKGTVHLKLPGLNKVCKKLNIDCAPAMTGFDFNGGWSHPVYDGFVVCQEFEEIVTEAWIKDQEEQERREVEKMEARVYGNWKRLIRGLFIKERLKCKYGFEEPSTSQDSKKKAKAPRLVVKKR